MSVDVQMSPNTNSKLSAPPYQLYLSKFSIHLQEVEQLKKALQKDEFRKLLVEYAKEISDPENRKRYEEEIAQLERDRGQDVKFLHPEVSSFHLSTHASPEVELETCRSSNTRIDTSLSII